MKKQILILGLVLSESCFAQPRCQVGGNYTTAGEMTYKDSLGADQLIPANTSVQIVKLDTYFGSPPLFADATLIFMGAVGVPVFNDSGMITGCSAVTSQVIGQVKGINGGFGSNLGCDFSFR